MTDHTRNPEQISRGAIDIRLSASGWTVQDVRDIDHAAGPGIAIREYRTSVGPADYVLFADREALGVVEAKPDSLDRRGAAMGVYGIGVVLAPALGPWFGGIGVNLLAVFMERRTAFHADAFAATQTSDNPATMELLQQVGRIMHTAGLPDTHLLPAASQFLGQVIPIQANTAAFQDGFLVVTLVFLIALVPTFLMYWAGKPAIRPRRIPGGGRSVVPRS